MTASQVGDLRDAFQALLGAISSRQDISDHLAKIEGIHGSIAVTAPPQLNHFVENRSYTKALEFLSNGVVVEPEDKPECDEDHP